MFLHRYVFLIQQEIYYSFNYWRKMQFVSCCHRSCFSSKAPVSTRHCLPSNSSYMLLRWGAHSQLGRVRNLGSVARLPSWATALRICVATAALTLLGLPPGLQVSHEQKITII